ncbi:unnamed protein product [Spirodela intermedia]|uniref:Uncharacterized protein n=1 Tax=Spirodela intermedia TaxID=51605 RepID=A0A7I8J351_SPIIN|nr:unnamed protein product [Spirodela intermedia]CAA6664402.1 unnamed protein product [Spirodela intermedia]
MQRISPSASFPARRTASSTSAPPTFPPWPPEAPPSERGRERGCYYLAEEHLDAALHEEHPPTVTVDGGEDHRPKNCGATLESDGLEEHGSVEGDHVDPSHLLEEGYRHRHHEVVAVAPPQQLPEGAAAAVLRRPRDLEVSEDAVQLGVHVGVGASYVAEGPACGVDAAAGGEAAGSVGDDGGAHEEDHCGSSGEAEGQPPSPVAIDPDDGVAHEVSSEHTDAQAQLESGVERPAPPRRRHLRQENRPAINISKLAAPALMAAPPRNKAPPEIIRARRPTAAVRRPPTRDATRPAMYREEMQYLSGRAAAIRRRTLGKNFSRKGPIVVTPPGPRRRRRRQFIAET